MSGSEINSKEFKELDDDAIGKLLPQLLESETGRKVLKNTAFWRDSDVQPLIEKMAEELRSGYVDDQDGATLLLIGYLSGNSVLLQEAYERMDGGDEQEFKDLFGPIGITFDEVKRAYEVAKN